MPQRAKDGAWQMELMGVAEIAIAFGVEKSTVTRWANEGLLPEPIDTLMLGRIWSYKSILKLFASVNPEAEALDEGAGRIYGERLRALKTLREMREEEKRAQNGNS